MTITVYTKPACVQCNATYKALDKQGLDYEIVDITEDAGGARLRDGAGVPAGTRRGGRATSTGRASGPTASRLWPVRRAAPRPSAPSGTGSEKLMDAEGDPASAAADNRFAGVLLQRLGEHPPLRPEAGPAGDPDSAARPYRGRRALRADRCRPTAAVGPTARIRMPGAMSPSRSSRSSTTSTTDR